MKQLMKQPEFRALCVCMGICLALIALAFVWRVVTPVPESEPKSNLTPEQTQEISEMLTELETGIVRQVTPHPIQFMNWLINAVDWWDVALALNVIAALIAMFNDEFKQCCGHMLFCIVWIIIRLMI